MTTSPNTPVSDSQRIGSLDELRGFALLGILLMNIVGFGLISSAYSNPGEAMSQAADIWVWVSMELFGEGAMRALFSMLFGAGVVLFTTGVTGKSAALHYKRNFWLLVFGLVDGFILLWTGDILVTYALVGFLLYPIRNVRPSRLLWVFGILLVGVSLMYTATQFSFSYLRDASATVQASENPEALSEEIRALATAWDEISVDFTLSEEERLEEIEARRGSYVSAFGWSLKKNLEMLLFVMPMYLFWDALIMMLLGMVLYKNGTLQGERSTAFYWRLTLLGFGLGLAINGVETYRSVASDFDFVNVFAQAQPTYHLGRLGIALGYIGLLMLLIHKNVLVALRRRLSAVGRMALTNYLMQSLICLLLFTGAGLSLVGTLSRAELYGVVLAIWVLQLWLSPWWLDRYRFGPIEWLWRGLTYGSLPANKRVSN